MLARQPRARDHLSLSGGGFMPSCCYPSSTIFHTASTCTFSPSIPNCYFRRFEKASIIPKETFVKGNKFGVETIDHFTWKDLFDSYACTECGRCQIACPATNTGKPLNPRQIIHYLKINLLVNGPAAKKSQNQRCRSSAIAGKAASPKIRSGPAQKHRCMHGSLPGIHRTDAQDPAAAALPGGDESTFSGRTAEFL